MRRLACRRRLLGVLDVLGSDLRELAEVGAPDGVVGHRFACRPLRDHRAEVEDVQATRERADHVDVVLDQQDRGAVLALDVLEGAYELRGLVAIEAGRGLVEQHEERIGHERAGDLDEASASEAEGLDRPIGHVVEPEELQRVVHARALVDRGLGQVQAVLPESAGAVARALCDQEVVAHGHAAEELDALERPSEAEPGSPVDRGARDVAAVEHDGPAVGPEHAEQAVEERGLARAVRADESDGFARLDGDRDVVER